MEKEIEDSMLKNRFTPKDIHRIKNRSRRSGNSIEFEIINLGNGLFRLILIFLLIALTLCSAIYFNLGNNHASLIISFFIAISVICFSSVSILRYKSIMFIKNTKKNSYKEYNHNPYHDNNKTS